MYSYLVGSNLLPRYERGKVMASINIWAKNTERQVEVSITHHESDNFHCLTLAISDDRVVFYLTPAQLDGIIAQIGGE